MARGRGPVKQSQQPRVEEEDQPVCPLCIEQLDPHERTWFPCACGYQVCAFCYQRLRLENNNQCPGCRTEYGTSSDAAPEPEVKSRVSSGKTTKSAAVRTPNGVYSPSKQHGDSRGFRAARGRSEDRATGAGQRGGSKPRHAAEAVGEPSAAESHDGPNSTAGPPPLRMAWPHHSELDAISGSSAPSLAVSKAGQSSYSLPEAAAGAGKLHAAETELAEATSHTGQPDAQSEQTSSIAPCVPNAILQQDGSSQLATSAMDSEPLLGQTVDSTDRAASSGDSNHPVCTPWLQLLARGRAAPHPEGLQLRTSIQQAIERGALSSREGASKLVAFLDLLKAASTRERTSGGAAKQHAVPLEEAPSKVALKAQTVSTSQNAFAASSQWPEFWQSQPMTTPELSSALAQKSMMQSHGHTSRADTRYESAPQPSRTLQTGAATDGTSLNGPHWLRAGVSSGLGLLADDGSAGNGVWKRDPLPASASIWGPRRLDADAVPDSLQELWAGSGRREDGLYASRSRAALADQKPLGEPFGGPGLDSSFSAQSSAGYMPHANGFANHEVPTAAYLNTRTTSRQGYSDGLASALSGLRGATHGIPQDCSQGLQGGTARPSDTLHLSKLGLSQQLRQNEYSSGLSLQTLPHSLGLADSRAEYSSGLPAYGNGYRAVKREPPSSPGGGYLLDGSSRPHAAEQVSQQAVLGLWNQQLLAGGRSLSQEQSLAQSLQHIHSPYGQQNRQGQLPPSWQAQSSAGYSNLTSLGTRLYQQ